MTLVAAPDASTSTPPVSRLARLAALAVTGTMLVLGTVALASFSLDGAPATATAAVQQH